MDQRTLDSVNRGDRLEGIFLVEGANLKTARNGKFFIQLTLRDHTAGMKAVRWESSQEEFRELDRNPFVRVQGRVEEYQGNLQSIIDTLEPVSASEVGLQAAEFLPRTPCDIESLERELEERVVSIKNESIRKLVVAVLARPGLRDQLRISPAGKSMHHAYIGGLLEHIVSLMNMADMVCDHYQWLDRDILISGVILHDIAKTAELGIENGFSYTDEGQLLGHIVLCSNWIDEAGRGIDEMDDEVLLQIQHIVASHHGQLEYGSPKKPMTAEALAMHYIDNLDAKLMGFLELYRSARPGPEDSRFGVHSYMLDVRPFFPRNLDFMGSFPSSPPARPATSSKPKQADRVADGESKSSGDLPF
ncbi:MAG: HD domain-containing protein [Planctomycetota bacterium]|nr:HD domain-containing protein [Planctomycetota bacterium]